MQKLYYSISEVSEIVGEPPYVLRYWEKEFPPLCPKKNRAGNRIYCEKDLEIIKTIKSLLREQKLSMRGAIEEVINLYGNPKQKQNYVIPSPQPRAKRISPKEIAPQLFETITISKINLFEIRNKLKSILDELKSM